MSPTLGAEAVEYCKHTAAWRAHVSYFRPDWSSDNIWWYK